MSYSPGETATVSFWVTNMGETIVYVDNLSMEFKFGTYDLKQSIGGQIGRNQTTFLGTMNMILPNYPVSNAIFKIFYEVFEYRGNGPNNGWVNLGTYETEPKYFINILPTPFYKVYVSRGLSVDDRAIGDRIVQTLREWGLVDITVGINPVIPDSEVPTRIRTEIANADGLIAIATPRYIDALSGMTRTLEWLYSESGIAYGLNKPLLLIREKDVVVSGLPGYLSNISQLGVFEFSRSEMRDFPMKLTTVMPAFREAISTKKQFPILQAVAGIAAVVGTGLIISGILGAIFGSSKK
jgi:hypothetical protein